MNKYDDRPYRVGKGKPPVEHRWKPGQSGNARKSKPKASPHELLAEKLRRIGQQPLTVTMNGKQVRMNALEAVLQAFIAELINGTQAQRLKAIIVLERLGVFTIPPENGSRSKEKRREFIEKLAEEARRENGG